MARLTVRITSAPYTGAAVTDALDFAIAATNYGHGVTLLFEGLGIYAWQHSQSPAKGTKSIAKRLKSLPLFDIDLCYVCQQSVTHYGVAVDNPQACLVSSQQIIELLHQTDHVVTF